ncbi:MAG: hypothetical protein Q4F35_08285 [Akkermansia sp.]|nr:hypothetical protein [Akkermansia sp.]
MKLRLRKPWFVAVMAAIATMPALHAANLTVDVTSYTDSTLNVSGTLKLIPTRISEGSEAVTYEWTPTSTTATMTGAGTITNLDSISKYDAPIINVSAYLSPDWDVNQTLEATNATHSISVGNVTFDDSALFLNVRGTHDINATFTNLGTLGLMQCTADLTDAKFSKQADLSLYKATVIAPRDGLIVSNDLRLMSDGYLVSDKPRDASNYITGDVTLAGGGLWPGLTGNPQNLTLEQYRTYKGGVIFSWFGCIDASVVIPPMPEYGIPGSATYMYYDFPTLEISGKLSVTEETGISICFNPTLKETYPEATALPSEDTPIFICLQFTGDQKLLKPYQLTPNETSNDFISHTFLENYEFEMRTGEGGKTYIYLVGGMSTPPTGGGGGGGSSPIDPPTGDEGDDIDPIDPPSGGEDPNPEIPPSSLSYEILTKEQQDYSKPILKVNGDTPLYATGAYDYEWNNTDSTTLTIEGSGTVSTLEDNSSEAWMTVHLTNSQTASIGGDITFDYVCLDLYGGTYDIDSTFTNGAAVYLTDAAANINDATFTNASQLSLSNSTLNCDTLTVSNDLHLQAYTKASTINGDLVLNGGVVHFDWYESDSGAFPTLTVTGSITIQAATQICFSSVPTPENYLFIANSVNEEKLNLLAAYTEDMYANTTALEGYEFGTSVSDKDGKVRIYLVEMDSPGDEGGEGGSDPIDPPSGGEGEGGEITDPITHTTTAVADQS